MVQHEMVTLVERSNSMPVSDKGIKGSDRSRPVARIATQTETRAHEGSIDS